MRASLRTAATLGLALCASLLPGAIGADNVDANGDPCTNSVNGVTTAATDVDANTIIIGCGNVVANNSAINDDFKLEIKGSRNIIRDNVGKEGSNTFGVYGSDNTFIANEADYFFLGTDSDGRRAYDNDVERNVARGRGGSGWLGISSTNGSTIISNDADYIAMYHGLDNDVERNKAGSAEHPGKIWVDGKRDVVLDNVALGGGGKNPTYAYIEVTTSDSGNTITGNEADYIGVYDSYNNTVTGNTAGSAENPGYLWLDADTSNIVENNEADYIGVDSDVTSVVKNNKVSTALYVGSDVNVTIQSDTVVDGELYSYDNDNSLDQGNHLKTYHGFSYNDHAVYKNNTASSDYIYSDKYVDVESNEADYRLAMVYVNYGPYWDQVSDYGMEFDIGAPVTGVCASFAADSSATPPTTSLPATPCPITVPPGAMLSAGTEKVPGGVCTGNTIIKLQDAADDTDLQASGSKGNAVSNDDYGGGGCSLVQFINGGETAVEVNIIANCFVDGSANEADCTGTVGYDVRGFKTTVVKNNKADYMYMYYIVGADIEDNVADYNIVVESTFNFELVNNTAQHIDVSSDYATTGNVNFKPTVISGNRVDADIQAHYMKNITATNNVVEGLDFSQTSDIVHDGVTQGAKPLTILNDRFSYNNHGEGYGRPVVGELFRFSVIGAGEITAITDDVTTISGNALKTTAVSAKQVVEMAAAMTTATTAGAAADTAMQALITALTAEVATLKTGFCPPAAAGRHLLAELTPIVPPAGCPGAPGSGGSVTPPAAAPAAVTNPTHVATSTLSLSGIDLTTFSTSNVAAALAATAGVNPADVVVVVTDYPVSTTVSFAGVSQTSLSAAEITSITNAIDANLPTAMVPTLGAVTPAGRRLLDLSFPVTITGVGADPTAAAAAQAAVTSPTTLGAAATAAGVPSTAVTATPATVSVTMTITVSAASAASAANIAAALAPANVNAITAALAAAGVTNTGVTITAAVVGEAPKPAASSSSSSQDKKDLLALLVLLIIPIANAAYFGGKYLERKRAAKEQALNKGVDSVVVVETA